MKNNEISKKFLNRIVKLDRLSILIVILLSICLGFAIGIWYNSVDLTDCEENPFVYGSQVLESKYGVGFFGSGQFLSIGTPTIYFNSKNMTIEPFQS